MSDSERSGVICAGHWIVDIVHDIDQWPQRNDLVRISAQTLGIGGGAANVITNLRTLGVNFKLTPVGKLGRDRYGDFAIKHCECFNLNTQFLVRENNTPTGHTHVMNVPGESRTFFYQGGTNDTLSLADFNFSELEATGSKIFYLGYLVLLEQLDSITGKNKTQASEVLKNAQDAGMITCVDLVSVSADNFAEIVSASLTNIDYLIINEVEASRATDISVVNSNGEIQNDALLQSALVLLNNGVNQAVVIHTPDVALWIDKTEKPVWTYPEPVKGEDIISTVGAGDAFCAGVLYGIHEQWSVENTLKLAHRAARTALAGQTATDGIKPIVELVPELVSGE